MPEQRAKGKVLVGIYVWVADREAWKAEAARCGVSLTEWVTRLCNAEVARSGTGEDSGSGGGSPPV